MGTGKNPMELDISLRPGYAKNPCCEPKGRAVQLLVHRKSISLRSCCALVCQGCRNTLPRTEQLKEQKRVVPQSWRPEVQHQRAGRAMLSLKAPEQTPSLPLPSFRWLSGILLACGHTLPVSAWVITWLLLLCLCLCIPLPAMLD